MGSDYTAEEWTDAYGDEWNATRAGIDADLAGTFAEIAREDDWPGGPYELAGREEELAEALKRGRKLAIAVLEREAAALADAMKRDDPAGVADALAANAVLLADKIRAGADAKAAALRVVAAELRLIARCPADATADPADLDAVLLAGRVRARNGRRRQHGPGFLEEARAHYRIDQAIRVFLGDGRAAALEAEAVDLGWCAAVLNGFVP